MKKTKFNWKGYWNPTPKSIRKIADGLLVFCSSVSVYLFEYDQKEWGLTALIAGLVFKFISNMFTEAD